MTHVEQSHEETLALSSSGLIEQVDALKAESEENRRAAFEADSIALGAIVKQLALQEAGLEEVYVSKPELVTQATDILKRLGLDNIARGVAVSTRRVGAMY